MVYDLARGRVVLLGGGDGSAFLADTWIHGDLVPAQAGTFRAPCAGTNGPPRIASSVPFLGNRNLLLDLVSARASAPCLFGLSPWTQDLRLGGGCALYLRDPRVFLLGTTNAGGFASTRFAIPSDLALRGAAVYAQDFAGLSFSAGLRLVLGD